MRYKKSTKKVNQKLGFLVDFLYIYIIKQPLHENFNIEK